MSMAMIERTFGWILEYSECFNERDFFEIENLWRVEEI